MLAELSMTSTIEREPPKIAGPFDKNSGRASAVAKTAHSAMRQASSSSSFSRLIRYERRN